MTIMIHNISTTAADAQTIMTSNKWIFQRKKRW